jgi:glutathione synthase/RimK-type ligase-like ATP-grasp enzyme
MKMDVALASCLELPEPDPDAAPLAAALDESGLSFAVLAWDDPSVNWSVARMTVLRSTWNYPQRAAAFLAWAESTARVTQLWNPISVLRWNLHKRYLISLARLGIPVVPTELVQKGSDQSLSDVLVGRSWGEGDVVVKPAVSAASYRTARVTGGTERGEVIFRELVAVGDVLVQMYLPSVEDYGERSMVWIEGELTHAVRKKPRFEEDEESVSSAVEILPTEAELANRVIEAVQVCVNEPLMYARVDVAPGPSGDPVVMELELIEPSLYFPPCPSALHRFVRAIRKRMNR